MTTAFEALLDLAAGRFDEAEAAAERGQELAAANDSPFGEGVYGLQMFAIRRAAGPPRTRWLPSCSCSLGPATTRPMWRPGLAALYAELGMVDEAARGLRAAPARPLRRGAA